MTSILPGPLTRNGCLKIIKIAKKLIKENFNLARRLFDLDDDNSEASDKSDIYISSSEDKLSDGWESDYSTDTEELVARIERDVFASPMWIGEEL